MPTGFWVKGYWGGGSAEPIKTIQIKLSAEPIKNIEIERSAEPIKTIQIERSAELIKNIQIEGSAEPIKIIQYHETTDASTQAPPLALVPVTCPHRASCNLYIVNVGPAQLYTHVLLHRLFCRYSQVLRGSTTPLRRRRQPS